MRRFFSRLTTFAGMLLTLGACADTPTQLDFTKVPDLARGGLVLDQRIQGCVLEGLCVLPPLIVDPGACDPWMSLDWCGGNCITSVFQPLGQTLQTCPGEGGGGAPGGGTPPPPPADPGGMCPTADDGTTCIPEEEEEEEESIICPSDFLGHTQPKRITIAGRNHEFQFHSYPAHPFVLKSTARSPAIYYIRFPSTSKDSWWIAESGTITVWCRGVYITRTRTWVGVVTVLDEDLHMVMGPGHPDF